MDRIDHYVRAGLRRVEGWLDPYSARLIADLAAAQGGLGVSGAFGEIGVHHGKLFILLRLAMPEAPGFAIDLFDDQHLNVDASGSGDRRKFEANIAAWAPGGGPLTIVQRSSLEVAPDEILAAVGPCRIVSVDGGHTEECARSDLGLAEAVLAPGGVAILDDYFNVEWPDVSTGMARYCLDPATALRPFAISPSKVFLARPDWHERLLEALVARQPDARLRWQRMFGHAVYYFRASRPAGPPSFEALDDAFALLAADPWHTLRHAVSRSFLGPPLIRLRDRVRGRSR